jgi:hypothetical protein
MVRSCGSTLPRWGTAVLCPYQAAVDFFVGRFLLDYRLAWFWSICKKKCLPLG